MNETTAEHTRAIVTQFYRAFERSDGDAMAALYHPNVRFSDPVFPELEGLDAKDMWRMLCKSAVNLRVSFEIKKIEANQSITQWQARYEFSKTGRTVHNVIESRMKVENGLIVWHQDRFSFWRWARQALGPLGLLLGWSSAVRKKVQAGAADSLRQFQRSNTAPT